MSSCDAKEAPTGKPPSWWDAATLLLLETERNEAFVWGRDALAAADMVRQLLLARRRALPMTMTMTMTMIDEAVAAVVPDAEGALPRRPASARGGTRRHAGRGDRGRAAWAGMVMAMRLQPSQRIDMESPALDAAEAGQWIAVACRCGHSGTMGPHTYGYAAGRLRDLARLMRCQQCRSRGAVRVWLVER